MSDKELVIYKEFQHWCAKNPSYDLDPRLHQHSGSIENGGYIAHEKTRVAFAAYRASSPVLAPPAPKVSSPQQKAESVARWLDHHDMLEEADRVRAMYAATAPEVGE